MSLLTLLNEKQQRQGKIKAHPTQQYPQSQFSGY
jgi:hypothetical protein